MNIPLYLNETAGLTNPPEAIELGKLRQLLKPAYNEWLLLSPKAAGDCYQHLTLLKGFAEVHCRHGEGIRFVTSPKYNQLCAMFPGRANYMYLNGTDSLNLLWHSFAMSQSFAPGQIIPLGYNHLGDGRLCRFAFLRNISSMEIIKFGLRLPFDLVPEMPRLPISFVESGRKIARDCGMVEGKSVVIFPHSRSFRPIDKKIFDLLASKVASLGLKVFSDVSTGMAPIENTIPFKCSLGEIPALSNFAGTAIAVRSGITDILSSFPCRTINVFPGVNTYQWTQTPFPYSFFSTKNALLSEKEEVVDLSEFATPEAASDAIAGMLACCRKGWRSQ